MDLEKDWKDYQQGLIQTKYVFSYDGVQTNKLTVRKILKKHLELAGVKDITENRIQ